MNSKEFNKLINEYAITVDDLQKPIDDWHESVIKYILLDKVKNNDFSFLESSIVSDYINKFSKAKGFSLLKEAVIDSNYPLAYLLLKNNCSIQDNKFIGYYVNLSDFTMRDLIRSFMNTIERHNLYFKFKNNLEKVYTDYWDDNPIVYFNHEDNEFNLIKDKWIKNNKII